MLVRQKSHVFLMEDNGDTPGCKRVDKLLEMEKVPGQPVYAMNMQRVTFTQVVQACIETWPVSAVAAKAILEYLIQMNISKLPGCILVHRAYTYVAYVCTKRHSWFPFCWKIPMYGTWCKYVSLSGTYPAITRILPSLLPRASMTSICVQVIPGKYSNLARRRHGSAAASVRSRNPGLVPPAETNAS